MSPAPLPTPSRAAFSVAPSTPTRATALLLHGYTGTPFEVRPVADALVPIGVASTGVLLPGHGTDPKELARTTWRDWERAALDAWDALPRGVPRIVVGFSMGGLLALRIAAQRDDVRALVLLSPALSFFADGVLAGEAARRGLWRVRPMVQKEADGGDVRDDEARRSNPTYPVMPLRGIGELRALQDVVRADLPRIDVPLCLIHGAQDHTIPPAASEEIARTVRSSQVEHHVLRDSWHIIAIDVQRHLVARLAARFVDRALGADA